MKELGIFKNNIAIEQENSTYMLINNDIQKIIDRHVKYVSSKLNCDKIPKQLPFLYWIPKMHKKPYSKQRYIAASGFCTTKPISKMLTKCFRLIDKQLKLISKHFFHQSGINPYWIILNSTDVFKVVSPFNINNKCENILTYDFSTLYTNIPHKKLKQEFTWIFNEAFKSSKKTFISVYTHHANWSNNPNIKTPHFTKSQLIKITHWLIDNIYVTFGDKCFQQKIGIPMGTDCAPYLANLFLFACEYKWIMKQFKGKKFHLLAKFKGCCRYIDDLLLINNDNTMKRVMSHLYPKELILVPDGTNGTKTHFLDLSLVIKNNFLSSSIYDKRDVFNFPIVNFPFLKGNIPNRSSYGVFIGELVRYARGCTFIKEFKDKSLITILKLKKQFFTLKMLKRYWFKFCKKHILLIHKYGSDILDFHKDWVKYF